MSYRDKESSIESSGFGKKLLGIGAFILAFILAKALVGGGLDFARQKSTTPASVERELSSNPTFAAYTQPLKKHFPSDYDRLISEFAEMARAGASRQEISAHAFNSSSQFINTHRRAITAASTETLVQVAIAHADLAAALASASITACAQWGFAGFGPNTVDSLPTSLAGSFAEPARLLVVAAHEGRSGKVKRDAELSDQDVDALFSELKAQGLSDDQLESLFSGKANDADVAEQCKMTVALYGGMAKLPSEQSARAIAAVLLNSD
jgi:hypothetical protein